mgnify:CR=1 FL=1
MKFEKTADGYQQRDRYYKALRRRQIALNEITREEPLIPLVQPYIQGKVRSFALSQRLAALPDSAEIQEALGFFNYSQTCRTGDFTYRKGKSRKPYPVEMELHRMSVYSVIQKKVPENLLKYFVEYSGRTIRSYSRLNELIADRYSRTLGFVYAAEVEISIEDHWITHQRANLPEVDAELDWIEQFVEQGQLSSAFYGHGSMLWGRFQREMNLRELRSRNRETIREAVDELHDHQQHQLVIANQKGGDNSSPFSFGGRLIFMKSRLWLKSLYTTNLTQPVFALV